ncbi:MAG: acetate kinase [Nitrospirae bacterium]|nr:acetate kinase [Nitrospirota bacterium]
MKILVINCGSSSLKYSLFDTSCPKPLFEGLIDKIGSGQSTHKMADRQGKWEKECTVEDVGKAFHTMETALTDSGRGAIKVFSEIKAVGHRVVHGGDRFSSASVITPEVKRAIREFSSLAPLHNPYNLAGIEEMERILPETVSVAVFDTAFHQTMPEYAYKYAIPSALTENSHIRRYGFHGTNHNFVALMASTFINRPVDQLSIITCHLGNGASICAIEHGLSIDTSMGFTPLEGLAMGTRCGDIDPGIVLYLLRSGIKAGDLDRLLNKESGLIGLSGISNDMREIIESADAGMARAKNALTIFCYRARKYIGAYSAILGRVDILVFTGGIGENSGEIRARICQGLDVFGITLDGGKNREAKVKRGHIVDISSRQSSSRVLVVAADEERMIARETIHAMRTVSV